MARLPDSLRLGTVELTVTDLDRAVAFYQDVIGLRVHEHDATAARLGTGEGEPLLVLHEDAQARPAGRHAGLYHVAYLFPAREDLAHAVLRLAAARATVDGASDHGVSEAIYVRDPDGNGIELYADRPRDRWPAPGPGDQVGMYTEPLDLDALLDLVRGQDPAPRVPAGLAVGHVHLHVGDLERARGFYGDALGLEVMTRYPGALFLAAGGYHHHLGVNTWRGEGAGAVPQDAVGLRRWTIVVEDPAAVAQQLRERGAEARPAGDAAFVTRDPWGIELLVAAT